MCSNDWSTDMCSSDLSGVSAALTPFIFIGPIFMPGISVIVRSIPENCATSASEKTSWIFVGAATTVSAAGVALLSLGRAWPAVAAKHDAAMATARDDLINICFHIGGDTADTAIHDPQCSPLHKPPDIY